MWNQAGCVRNESSMSFAFFIYTILVMGVGLVTASTALVIWLMTRRRDCLVAAAGFLLYIFDMSVIFFDEYNRLKYDYVVTFNEPLQHPLLRCALGVAILACVWLWVTFRLHDEVTVKRVAAYVVPIAVLQLALVPRTGFAGQVQQYLFGLRAIWEWHSAWYMLTLAIARRRIGLSGSILSALGRSFA